MQKIRIGFLSYNDTSWMGGINYLKNLLYAVNKLENQKIEPYIFFEKDADPAVVKMFKECANCVFLKYTAPGAFLNKILTRLTGRNHFLNYYVRKYKIDGISHSRIDATGVKAKSFAGSPIFNICIYLKCLVRKNLDYAILPLGKGFWNQIEWLLAVMML